MSNRCPNCGHHLSETPNYLDQVGPMNAMRRAMDLQRPSTVMHKPDVAKPAEEVKGERYYINGREYIKVLGITFCSVGDWEEVPAGFREFKTRTTTIPILAGLKPQSWKSRHAIKGGTKRDMERLCALWSDNHFKYEVI